MDKVSDYIPRRLVLERGGASERHIGEDELLSLKGPIVLIGEPGMGKTRLTLTLAPRLDAVRVKAGTLLRASTKIEPHQTLVIDGLDEVVASTGGAAMDAVLSKLAELGHPSFVVSCRAADWQGAVDRAKITEDYGRSPQVVSLLPFTRDEASSYLEGALVDSVHERSKPSEVLDELDSRGLADLYGNPLTLNLLVELILDGAGLPEGRRDLLERASELLLREVNPLHNLKSGAIAEPASLLHDAGAIFAYLLLSGSLGVANLPAFAVPVGYLHVGAVAGQDIPQLQRALGTRLFQVEGDGLYAPIHRIIAEFLAARWLAHRLAEGLSSRRLAEALTFERGVPTSLRGLHAWLAVLYPPLARSCIERDPFGVLRYADTEKLTIPVVRHLLAELSKLADDDPYFRSEDWGVQSVRALVREELVPEIAALVGGAQRHFHLSSLLLGSLQGAVVIPLKALLESRVLDEAAPYIERKHAGQALLGSAGVEGAQILLDRLEAIGSISALRLLIEILADGPPEWASPVRIAQVYLKYERLIPTPSLAAYASRDEDDIELPDDEDDDDEIRPAALGWLLTRNLPGSTSAAVLDEFARLVERPPATPWRIGWEFNRTLRTLIEAAVRWEVPSPARAWSWLRLLVRRDGFDKDEPIVRAWLREDLQSRRAIQQLALDDPSARHGPSEVIFDRLPHLGAGIEIDRADALHHLGNIASRPALRDVDIELWEWIIASQRGGGEFDDEFRDTVRTLAFGHEALRTQVDRILDPPRPKWEAEQAERKRRQDTIRLRKYQKAREAFLSRRDDIRSGHSFGDLVHLANGYLGRYHDLPNEDDPLDRLREWVGGEVAELACAGFKASLSRNDLPTSRQIAENHAAGRSYNAEAVFKCAIIEMVRVGDPLSSVPQDVLAGTLLSWWFLSEHYDSKFGDEVRAALEGEIFKRDEDIETFLRLIVEPQLVAKREHISGLHRVFGEEKFREIGGKLAIEWLRSLDELAPAALRELIGGAVQYAPERLVGLLSERTSDNFGANQEVAGLWAAAAFVVDFCNNEERLEAFAHRNPGFIWDLRAVNRWGPFDDGHANPLSARQLAFLVKTMAPHWPPVGHPSRGWSGSDNPWDATDAIRAAISRLSAIGTEEAASLLSDLIDVDELARYRDELKHGRAQQVALRRDAEFRPCSAEGLKALFSTNLPAGIDDLKAIVVDELEWLQDYVANSDTRAWEQFWVRGVPKDENTCRDRILDLLRGRVPPSIHLLPESLMPELKRVDILALFERWGVPIEIKGQWHPDVWQAANTQLYERYTRDWRADDRGVFVVLWFGNSSVKRLTAPPVGVEVPVSPRALKFEIERGVPASEASRLAIVVLDLTGASERSVA